MSDRKYRQRGYQDDPRDRERPKAGPKREQEPRAPGRPLQDAAGPRTPNLMASHEVFRCARCGNRLATPVDADARCGRCGVAVHSCINCVSFDTSARWECTQKTLPAASRRKTSRMPARSSRRGRPSNVRPERRGRQAPGKPSMICLSKPRRLKFTIYKAKFTRNPEAVAATDKTPFTAMNCGGRF